MGAKHTPGPWELIEATEHHGPYVVSPWGSTLCDCYVMTDPFGISTRNGGTSKPVPFVDADANARLIASAPDLLAVLRELVGQRDAHFHTVSAWDAARAAIAKAEGSE